MTTTYNYQEVERLKAQYRALIDNYEDGDIAEETLQDTAEGIQGELEAQADAVAELIDENIGSVDYIDKQIERLEKRKDTLLKNNEKLKVVLWNMMETCNKPKFKTATHSFSIANNGGVKPLVFVGGKANLDEIDDRFVKVKVDRDVDNKAIREALDNGEILDFVYYGERGRRLDIR